MNELTNKIKPGINYILNIIATRSRSISIDNKINTILPITAFCIALFPLYTNIAKADNFYNTGGNIWECNFAAIMGIQYNSLGGNGIHWNNSLVLGATGKWIQSKHLLNVADVRYPNAHKYPGLADEVSVPPNTSVEFGYWGWNYTWHDIFVDDIAIFTSRKNALDGDLTKLGAAGGYQTYDATGLGTRSGKAIRINIDKIYKPYTLYGGDIIYSFNTIQPIQAQNFTARKIWNGSNLQIEYTLQLKNTSTYTLDNIRVRDTMPSGQIYDKSSQFSPGQTKTIIYTENWGNNYPSTIINNGVRIWDNNSHTEIPTQTRTSISNWTNPNDRPGALLRSDSNSPIGWSSNQPIWGQTTRPPIKITLIPYWFDYGTSRVEVPANIIINKTVSDTNEINVHSNSARNQEKMTYTITVKNTGGTTNHVSLTDDYDQNFIKIINPYGGKDNGDTINWDIPVIHHNESVTYKLGTQILNLNHGQYSFNNIATTKWSNDSVTTNVTAEAILKVKKYVKNTTAIKNTRLFSGENLDGIYGADANTSSGSITDVVAIAGDTLEFNLVYQNVGDATSNSTFLKDHLPRYIPDDKGMPFEIIQITDFLNIDNSITPIAVADGWDIVWDIGNLAPGSKLTKTFLVKINSNSQTTLTTEDIKRILNNNSTIYSKNELIQQDTDNALLRVDQPNVTITKTSDKQIYQSNEIVTYNIKMTNNSKTTAIGTALDILPSNMSYLSATIPPTIKQPGDIQWQLILDPGEAKSIILKAGFSIPVKDNTSFDNHISFNYTDINNNIRPMVQDNTQVSVLAPIITIKKSIINTNLITPLNDIQYKIDIKNIGHGLGFDTTVTDKIDTKLVKVIPSTISDNGIFDTHTNTIIWKLGTINPQTTLSVHFSVRVLFKPNIQDGNTISNQAMVGNNTISPVYSNTAKSKIRCGYLSGTIWEDFNKNARIDPNERRIHNTQIKVLVAGFPNEGLTLSSSKLGGYKSPCIPYEKQTSINIIRPSGYIGQTTVDQYNITLSQSNIQTTYDLNKTKKLLNITAGHSFDHADLGLYRLNIGSNGVLGISKMSNTGTPIILFFILSSICASVLYLSIISNLPKNLYILLKTTYKTWTVHKLSF